MNEYYKQKFMEDCRKQFQIKVILNSSEAV
jgi:hypothetical protein